MPKSLKLADFADWELLHRLEEEADNEGWITSEELGDAIGISSDNPTQNVAIRLGWMKRYEVVEKDPEAKPARWRLTPLGESLLNGELTKGARNTLGKLDEGQMLSLMREVGLMYGDTKEQVAKLMRREFQYQTANRGWTR